MKREESNPVDGTTNRITVTYSCAIGIRRTRRKRDRSVAEGGRHERLPSSYTDK